MDKDEDQDQDGKKKYRPFNAIDVQKIRLEKLMNNIDKPIEIPTLPKPKNFANPPEFVRNIMGSSAGAGSGEFHVYRHIRRKEYARLNFIEAKAKQDKLDADFQKKIEENKRKMEETTAKKRAKRLKKKEKLKAKKTKKDDGDDNADHGGQDKDDNNENNDDSNDCNDSKNNSVISDSKNDNVV